MTTTAPPPVLPRGGIMPRTSRPDGTVTDLAAQLHELAAFITRHHLPDSDVAVVGRELVIDLTSTVDPETNLRRWAAALEQDVLEIPALLNGRSAKLLDGSGRLPDGTWVHLAAKVPVRR